MIKLAIIGGRDYVDYENFKKIVINHVGELGRVGVIISGGAIGVDTMAERFALENDIPTKIFKPNWTLHGRKAGILRNTDIINESTHVLALPTVNSVGTHDSIKKAIKFSKILKVVNV